MKFFYVDRFGDATSAVFDVLQEKIKGKNYQIIFIGPKDRGDFNSEHKKFVKKVWSRNNYVFEILKYVKKEKPSIIHINFEIRKYGSLRSFLVFPFLILFLKSANLKIITELHAILILHHDDKWEIQKLPYNLPNFIVKIFVKIFFKMIGKLSDKIIIHSKSGKIGLRDYYGIKDGKILVLPLAISKNIEPDPQKFKDMELLFKNRKIILSFGNISSRKGLEYAIKALNLIKNELPNHCLVIAGRSVREYQNYENMLHELVEKLQLQEKIIFMGFLDEDELNSLFKISEIVLYPYLPSSAASIGIIHSMYHQKPIIVSNIDTFNEIFKKNEAVFVEPKNEREIANAIILLANDPILRKSLQEKMEKISIDYSWEKIADRLIGLYEEIYSKTKTL